MCSFTFRLLLQCGSIYYTMIHQLSKTHRSDQSRGRTRTRYTCNGQEGTVFVSFKMLEFRCHIGMKRFFGINNVRHHSSLFKTKNNQDISGQTWVEWYRRQAKFT